MSQPITLPGKSAYLRSTHAAFVDQRPATYNTAAADFEAYKHVLTNRPLKRRKCRKVLRDGP